MAGENQYSFVKGLGDGLYPPLWIKSNDGSFNFQAKYIFLDSYSETYSADLGFEHVFGKLNSKVTYSSTERKIDVTFTMAARNVHEAKSNLDYCKLLARTVYGKYTIASVENIENTDPPKQKFQFDYHSQRTYIVNFGTFLRSQTVKVLSFDFSMNFDAGVFDYGSTLMGSLEQGELKQTVGKTQAAQWWSQKGQPSAQLTEQEYVYGAESGKVLPKLVNVTLSMLALDGVPACFGGEYREDNSVGWSLVENLDWPHGTGPIPAALYCRRDPGAGVEAKDRNKSEEPIFESSDKEDVEVAPTSEDSTIVVSEEAKQEADARKKRIQQD